MTDGRLPKTASKLFILSIHLSNDTRSEFCEYHHHWITFGQTAGGLPKIPLLKMFKVRSLVTSSPIVTKIDRHGISDLKKVSLKF